MKSKLKITDTDVVNMYNIDYYVVDGRKIIFYSNGAKYDSIFDSEKEALSVLVCILTSKVGLPLLTVQCRTPAPPLVPAAPKSTDV